MRRRIALARCRWRLRHLEWKLKLAQYNDDDDWCEDLYQPLEDARWALYLLENDR